jgi:hypothetical protein
LYDISNWKRQESILGRNVEIRGDMYRSLNQITLPFTSVFIRDPDAAEQVGLKFYWRRNARLKRGLI